MALEKLPPPRLKLLAEFRLPRPCIELARVWWNGTGPIMNIRPALAEPGNIGVVLAELAWHYSHAYAEHHGFDQAVAFKAICDSWDAAHAKAQAANTESAQ